MSNHLELVAKRNTHQAGQEDTAMPMILSKMVVNHTRDQNMSEFVNFESSFLNFNLKSLFLINIF